MNKTIFSKLMLGMLIAATGFVLTACGDDEEPKAEDNFSTEYTFTAELSADLLLTTDVRAYVLSPDGTVIEEAVTKASNKWILKGNSIPDKAGVLLEFRAKKGDFAGIYDLGYKVNRTVTCFNNDRVYSTDSNGYDESFTVDSENLPEFYGTGIILGGEINSAGKASVTDGDNLDLGLNMGISKPGGGRPYY